MTLLALEVMTYQIGETTSNVLTIQKTYEFSTEPKAGQKPLISIKGAGNIEFDLSAGVAKSIVMYLTEEILADGNRIVSMRPIFLTEKGQTAGPWFGVPGSTSSKLLAKKGYAVGGMRIRGGLWIDGLSLTFMEIGPKGLDPSKNYQSDWIGGNGGKELQLAGNGSPIVGVVGHGGKKDLTALGLVLGSQN